MVMPKSRNSDIDKECPICGGIIWGRGQNVVLEEANITVCDNCAQYGTKIHNSDSKNSRKRQYQKTYQSAPKKKIKRTQEIEVLEVVSDYASKIKNVRNKLKLNQDQFAQKINEKPSLLRRIEIGKVEPTIKLARKIEDTYKIRILQKTDSTDINIQDNKFKKKTHGSSLGDMAFVKKKGRKDS